jgi:hypothetical protein
MGRSFVNKFYGTDSNPSLGVQKLHQIIQGYITEIRAFQLFLDHRVACEERYISDLNQLKDREYFHVGESDLCSMALTSYQAEMATLSSLSSRKLQEIGKVKETFQNFIKGCENDLNPLVELIESEWKRYQQSLLSIREMEETCRLKNRMVEISNIGLSDDSHVDNSEKILIGNVKRKDFDFLVHRMQVEVPHQVS